jgi:hypothetical protein
LFGINCDATRLQELQVKTILPQSKELDFNEIQKDVTVIYPTRQTQYEVFVTDNYINSNKVSLSVFGIICPDANRKLN